MLEKLLEQVVEIIKNTKEFTLDQAPLYAQELIKYMIWDSAFWIIVSVIMIIVSRGFIKRGIKLIRDDEGYKNPTEAEGLLTLIAGMILMVAFLITLVSNIDPLFKAIAAPRVLIIDKISEQLHINDCKK